MQRHAKKLVGYGVTILNDDETLLSQKRIDVAGQPLAELEAESPGNRHAIVWLRYTVGARHFTSGWWAQLALRLGFPVQVAGLQRYVAARAVRWGLRGRPDHPYAVC